MLLFLSHFSPSLFLFVSLPRKFTYWPTNSHREEGRRRSRRKATLHWLPREHMVKIVDFGNACWIDRHFTGTSLAIVPVPAPVGPAPVALSLSLSLRVPLPVPVYLTGADDIQTRQYRSPEAIIGAKYSTPCDIWYPLCRSVHPSPLFLCVCWSFFIADVLTCGHLSRTECSYSAPQVDGLYCFRTPDRRPPLRAQGRRCTLPLLRQLCRSLPSLDLYF